MNWIKTAKIAGGVLLLTVIVHFTTRPPAPPAIPEVPAEIANPTVPPLTFYDQPVGGPYPVPKSPFRRTLRDVSVDDLVEKELTTGVYKGTPYWKKREQWFADNFYATLAARKVWDEGTSADDHERGGPVTWSYEPIPQYTPPPCDKPQPTGYDADTCRYVNSLYKDVEAKNPKRAKELREIVRKGRDVWFKGTFGNQDENYIHQTRIVEKEEMNYPWLDTRTRPFRFTKWGLINDPDCVQGDASTNWYDKCQDPHSSGVLGYRKYYADPIKDEEGKVVYNPQTAPYSETEIKENKRYVIGHPCVQCHVGFNPVNPPKDPNEPKWENLSGTIGNQHIRQPLAFFQGAPRDNLANQMVLGGRMGTIDTSLVASDWQHNPGTQNNIMDFHNKRLFDHEMKNPVTGEISTAKTRHVLKGGEDSVGEHLALIRVYVNIGLCTEECWVPNFPYPGQLLGRGVEQSPMRIMQCANACDAWNYADSKMEPLAAYLMTAGPTYIMKARDNQTGTSGKDFVDTSVVPEGRDIYARECASCHSSNVAPVGIRNDKKALEKYYEGHVFGSEEYWEAEFDRSERTSPAFIAKYMAKDKKGKLRPRQFAEKGIFGQDWLGNDERIPFSIIGTNNCRSLHDNHNEGHIWEEFASETYRSSPSPGSVDVLISRMVPGLGGLPIGSREIKGGPGYYRNISLLSIWAHAPFLHNNAIGEMTYLPRMPDGSPRLECSLDDMEAAKCWPDYSIEGRIDQFHLAYEELMMSDNEADTPHRVAKITGFADDVVASPQEDGKGFPPIPLSAGVPVATLASLNPHFPLVMKCPDIVENKGHQFGVDLSKKEKYALREFLKMM